LHPISDFRRFGVEIVYCHYESSMDSSKFAGGRWTAHEDNSLKQGVAKLGAKNWKAIS